MLCCVLTSSQQQLCSLSQHSPIFLPQCNAARQLIRCTERNSAHTQLDACVLDTEHKSLVSAALQSRDIKENLPLHVSPLSPLTSLAAAPG